MGIEDKDWLNLSEDEKVVWWEHPTVLMFIPRYIFGTLIAVSGAGLFTWNRWRNLVSGDLVYLPLTLVVFGILYVIYSIIHRRSIYYVATNEKIVRKDGIIRRHRNPIYYSRISNIKSEESVPERIVSFFVPGEEIGDMHIHTADDELGDLEFRNVSSIHEGNQRIADMMSNKWEREECNSDQR